MEKFIKNILYFSIIILIIAGIFEYMLRQTPNIFRYKRELIEKKANEIHTIIIGNSVVNCGIDPKILSKDTYNMAISGQWTRFNSMFLKRYLDSMKELRTIIWGQCYHSLWMDDSDEFSLRSIVDHNLYMDIKLDNDLIHRSELISLRAMALRKWSKYYIKGEATMNCDDTGLDHSFDSSNQESDWKQEIIPQIKEQTNRMKTDHSGLYNTNLRIIESIAEECIKKGIRLILVIPPVYSDYQDLANKRQLELLQRGCTSIAKKYSNVYFLDYFLDSRFTEKDFYNGNHLNSDIGAPKFTTILKGDLESAFPGQALF